MANPRCPGAAIDTRAPGFFVAAQSPTTEGDAAPRDARVARVQLAWHPTCVISACGENVYANGLCHMHHLRRLAAIPVDGISFRSNVGGRSQLSEDVISLISALVDHGWSWGRLSELFAVPARALRDYVAANHGEARNAH